jgi:hypothetical protein
MPRWGLARACAGRRSPGPPRPAPQRTREPAPGRCELTDENLMRARHARALAREGKGWVALVADSSPWPSEGRTP